MISQTKCWKCWKSNGTPYGCSWFKASVMPKGATGVSNIYGMGVTILIQENEPWV